MKTLVSRFIKSESGATAIEYGLIAALVSVVIITAITTITTLTTERDAAKTAHATDKTQWETDRVRGSCSLQELS